MKGKVTEREQIAFVALSLEREVSFEDDLRGLETNSFPKEFEAKTIRGKEFALAWVIIQAMNFLN